MSGEKPKATILIVDDERGPRDSLRMILSPTYRVLQASSGANALDCLREESVDLMTLDLNMPGMHGQDLMQTVRDEFPHIEIVIITGCGTVESAAAGIRSGICDYLQKPFDVVQVSAAVDRALTRQQARTRLGGFLSQLGDVVGRDRGASPTTPASLPNACRSRWLKWRISASQRCSTIWARSVCRRICCCALARSIPRSARWWNSIRISALGWSSRSTFRTRSPKRSDTTTSGGTEPVTRIGCRVSRSRSRPESSVSSTRSTQ